MVTLVASLAEIAGLPPVRSLRRFHFSEQLRLGLKEIQSRDQLNCSPTAEDGGCNKFPSLHVRERRRQPNLCRVCQCSLKVATIR